MPSARPRLPAAIGALALLAGCTTLPIDAGTVALDAAASPAPAVGPGSTAGPETTPDRAARPAEGAAPPASPSPMATTTLRGSWVYDRATSDDVNKAIDTLVARLNVVMRPIMRGRLRRLHQPVQRFVVAIDDRTVTLTMDQLAPVVTAADGTEQDWKAPDGEAFRVSTTWSSGQLKQTFRAQDGMFVRAFSLGPDGTTMTVEVSHRSPKLPQQLWYKLGYNRS